MRFHTYILALWCLGAAGGAWAGSAAEVRAKVEQAQGEVQALAGQKTRLRAELTEASGRIQELKAQQRDRLIPGGELSGLLRRSQELAGSLTGVEAALARAEGEVQQRRAALVDALDGELESARSVFDRAGREDRRALLGRMRALRRERDELRAQLPAAQLPQVKGGDSDDPADLLEQADALRDTQDKVVARLKALDRRIAELKREQELDRRMGEFLGEEQAFDERDRRLVGNNVTGLQSDARGPEGAIGVTLSMSPPAPASTPPPPSTGPARDGELQMSLGTPPATGGEEALSALEKQRQELDAVSKQLGARANELEQRARSLK